LVPGIDLSNDPLLQGRLFSYLDTQLLRLGGPNFAEIPINSPRKPVNNNQQDGFHRRGHTNKVNYFPNSRASGCPMMAAPHEGGFVHYPEPVSGVKTRERAEGFKDFYSQATLFWESMTGVEKQHIVEAAWFELGKVSEMAIRERVVEHFARINYDLAIRVAGGVGVESLTPARVEELQKEQRELVDRLWKGRQMAKESPALSMEKMKKADSIEGRKVGILAEPGANTKTIMELKEWLMSKGAMAEVVSSKFGNLGDVKVDKSYITTASVLYDSIIIVDGEENLNRMVENGETIHFVNEVYKHCKTIATVGKGQQLLSHTALKDLVTSYQESKDPWEEKGVVGGSGLDSGFLEKYEKALAKYRHWQRGFKDTVPA
jgi:catalase